MNKYLVSVDIEGITGVVDTNFSRGDGKLYELAKRYMLHDTNAVIEGILASDKNAYIVVRDAHGMALNLDLERLHPAAHLLQGWGNSMNMLEGLDNTYKGVFLVGYHGGGQGTHAVLGHSFSKVIHSLKLNGELINETGVAALYAGHHNVPIAFISGDNYAIAEAKEQLADNFSHAVGVVVKESYGRDSALSLPLAKSRDLLSKGAAEATVSLLNGKIKPWRMQAPFSVEVKFYNIGYERSIYSKICGTLLFDKGYSFDKENFVIKYASDSQLEICNKLNLIVALIYGAK
jgi:D-amino peptidase